MTAALITQALVILALVAALIIRERDHDQALTAQDERAQTERRELATRIQRPELVPTGRKQPREPAIGQPKDLGAYAVVGRARPPMSGPRPDQNGEA